MDVAKLNKAKLIEVNELDVNKKYMFCLGNDISNVSGAETDRFFEYLLKLGLKKGNIFVYGGKMEIYEVKDGEDKK